MNEPGEHELVVARSDVSDISVRVLWYNDWKSWGFGAKAEGRLLLEGRTTLEHFRSQVVSAARDILESLGPAEYRVRRIEHDFPLDAYDRLRGAG